VFEGQALRSKFTVTGGKMLLKWLANLTSMRTF